MLGPLTDPTPIAQVALNTGSGLQHSLMLTQNGVLCAGLHFTKFFPCIILTKLRIFLGLQGEKAGKMGQ